MITVIIADDHDLIRDGFKKLLDRESDITMAGEAKSAAELFGALENGRPDVVVLDISLPDKNGIDVLKEMKVQHPDIRILVLSMHPEERYAVRALRNGAAGYITKGSASEELIKAVRKVALGGRYISDILAEELAFAFSDENDKQPHEKLSDREYQILLLLGGGKSVQQIADSLSLSINTVNTYRRRIMEKTSLHGNSKLIQYVIQHNLIE